MPAAWFHHLPQPRSLRQQFTLALLIVAVLIVAGGLIAVYALRMFANTAQELAGERLAQMQTAQDLFQRTLLIEHETSGMLAAGSLEETRSTYASIIKHLEELDSLVRGRGAAGNDVAVLALYQSGQRYRSLVHVVARLQGDALQTGAEITKSLQERAQRLLEAADPAALKLAVLLYRLRDEDRPDQIEVLRDEFVRQAGAGSQLPPVVLDDLQSLRADAAAPDTNIAPTPFSQRLKFIEQQQIQRHFQGELQRQTAALLKSSETLSALFTGGYREAVTQLAGTSRNGQHLVLLLLGSSLFLAWLFFRYFLGKHVLARLQIVSHFLRSCDTSDKHPRVPVQGDDEIGEMARRVEQFLEDRQQLAERKAELVLARDAAEAANKAKSVFLANMSHELRTPLNAILGFSSMMRREPQLTANQKENLDIINRSGEHLLSLINDVLQMAKIEAGRVQMQIAPFDLGGMVRDVVDMMRLRAEEKGLRLQLDQHSSFPRFIKGDEARLREVLVNLVGNAIKFTVRGGVTIRLGVKQNARQHLVMEVADTGPGISPEDQQRLFQPFVQLGKVGTQKGTGLGLAISRQFARLMGGAIGVESMPGKGAIFRLDLPVELATEAEVAGLRAAPAAGEVAGLLPGQPQYRILITEDQYENRLLLGKAMTSLGLEVKEAENGEQCVKVFQEWHPHLIWMDRRMPVMDGVEATRRIRQLPGGKDVKIVAVTASVFEEQVQELLDAGMDGVVRKPYRIHEIYDCMARQLGVTYVYQLVEGEAAPAEVTPAMLAVLPAAMRKELKDALESLDSDHITAAIQQVSKVDAALAQTLSRMTDNFDYPAILHALAPEMH